MKLNILSGIKVMLPATVLALQGCAFHTETPPLAMTDVPTTWMGPMVEDAQAWPDLDWWTGFNDQELNEIIELVRANNLDLENNARNLEAAQLNLRSAGFDLLPTPVVTLGTGARYIETDPFGDGIEEDNTPNQPFDLQAGFTYNNILSKPASYRQAVADYDSRVAQVGSVALNTLGTAASTYFQILLARDKIEAARQNVENAEAIGEIANARVEAGVAVPIEALQQQISIEQQRNNLRSLIQNDLSARASLALLTGQGVQSFDVEGDTLLDIEVPGIRPGVPSELLRRRPDLVQAEAGLRAAAANVDIVYTNLFPQISLTGSLNASSSSLSDVVSFPDAALTISASLVQTLLDNGQRYRNLDQARLSLENSLNDYRTAVIGAFNDIEVLLSNIQVLEAQGETAQRNLDAAEESFRIAQARYEEGVADFETVLISQNTLFSTRNAFLDNKLLQLNAMVGLYQALGGGWDADNPQ